MKLWQWAALAFVAGVVLGSWSATNAEHERDDADDDGDDGEGLRTHDRANTRDELMERIRVALEIPEDAWHIEGPRFWGNIDPAWFYR